LTVKRKDLSVGLVVDLKFGRDYPSWGRAIVVATEPWEEPSMSPWWGRHEGPRFIPSRDGRGQGVAVAIRNVTRHLNDDGTWADVPPTEEWNPSVVPASQVRPLGEWDAWKAAQEASRERSAALRREREDLEASLRRRFEPWSSPGYSGGLSLRDGRVTVSASDFGDLLTEVENLRDLSRNLTAEDMRNVTLRRAMKLEGS
jgi:hypothetical protein